MTQAEIMQFSHDMLDFRIRMNEFLTKMHQEKIDNTSEVQRDGVPIKTRHLAFDNMPAYLTTEKAIDKMLNDAVVLYNAVRMSILETTQVNQEVTKP